MVSLRFSGLEVDGVSLEPSPSLESAWFIGVASRFRDILEGLSGCLRSAGLVLLQFSCPVVIQEDKVGVAAFPPSDELLRTRLIGLFGDVRVRDVGRGDAAFERPEDLSASFALGGKGTARGEGVWGVLLEELVKKLRWEPVLARLEGERGDGESGDFGDELGDFFTRLNLDGERERERLRDLTAEVTST